ncbi:MAG: hypothetical protein EOM19_07270 [Candidatus Moranbacteria bacterium]|nr:hypothetical protein [Candidatus Moranbacteria bacterium]
MFTKEFIETVFIAEIKQMTIGSDGKARHPYIGFSLICQSIEVLGACFDEYNWEDRSLSELRFRLAINKLFLEKYKECNGKNKKIDLYKHLRCPMIHQMRPGRYIGLSERKHEETAKASNLHLTKQGEQLLLIYEDFLNDFILASKKLFDMIDSGELRSEKVLGHSIFIPSDFEK